MQAVVVLRINMVVQNAERSFSLDTPYICMAAPQDPAKDADLAEVKVVNESGEKIVMTFLGKAPCSPATIAIPEVGKPLLTWESTIPLGKYYFVVSQDAATDTGGNVTPVMGTIDIVVVG